MAKRKNNKGAIVLAKLRTRAKALVKARGLSYQDALSKAGEEYRGGHKAAGKPKKAHKATPRHRASKGHQAHKVSGVGMTAGQHKREALQLYEHQLARAMLRHYNATTKTEKKKIGKEITELKRCIRNLH